MKTKELKKLYNSKQNRCCVCGCTLIDNAGVGLGRVFVLDKDGNFYCSAHDEKFNDPDDRIFEADLYEDGEEENEEGNR